MNAGKACYADPDIEKCFWYFDAYHVDTLADLYLNYANEQ